MSTVTTRTISKTNMGDIVPVRCNLEDYTSGGANKWGYLKIRVTGYSWTDGTGGTAVDAGTLSINVPNYSEDNDSVILAPTALTNTVGSVGSLTLDTIVAINNGVPGPSVRMNPDGSFDVLDMKYVLTPGSLLTNQTATLTYTVAFTDLTDHSLNNNGSTVTLDIHDDKFTDSFVVNKAASTFTAKNGYVTVKLNSLINNVDDIPNQNFDAQLVNADPVGDDGTPLFVFGTLNKQLVLSHMMAKRSGLKYYQDALWVFAINNGKVDRNGMNARASDGNFVVFTRGVMSKVAESPCDDYVQGVVNYTYAFTQVT